MKEIKIETDRIFIISDIHFGVRSNNLEWLEIQQDYFYNWFIPYIKKNKNSGDILFILGDIFDNRQSISVIILNKALAILEEISKIIPIYIIIGNHDTARKSVTDINSLKIFKYLPNVKIFETTKIIQVKDKKILLMPWQGNTEKEEIIIKSQPNCNYLFSHAGIKGFYYNKSIIMDEGININLLKKFDRVITGHIHFRQEKSNIIMPGCPYQLNRGDINNDKGIYIFYPENNKIEFIKNNYTPNFLRLNLEDVLEMSIEIFEKTINNNYVDIVSSIKWSINFPFNTLLEMSKCSRKINIIINPSKDNTDFIDETENDLSEFNILKLSKIYIENTSYPQKIKDAIYKKIQDLYLQAQSGEIE